VWNLWCQNQKLYIPKDLRLRIVNWYHETLCHPGANRTEETIHQHYTWGNMRETIRKVCLKCHTCQVNKIDSIKYGHLPAKEAESEPWEILCVDLIGPYQLKRKGKQPLELWCVTMIDPATSWFEIQPIKNKQAITVAEVVETTWLTRYPRPSQMIYDRGSEFLGEFAAMIVKDYGIIKKPISARNPQANSILERIHKTIGNMIRTFELNEIEVSEEEPWKGILAAIMYAIRSTYHTTLKATPMQLVFGRDAMLNIKFEANWQNIKLNKQKIIQKNNDRENATRKPHEYKEHDLVLWKNEMVRKYGTNPYSGPYPIIKVFDNGTVRLKRGSIYDVVNIRNIKPYRT
jgi:hypothetical protein